MNLFVAGLPFDMDDQELQEMFEEFGNVSSAKVILDRETHKSRGFGFVDMPDNTAAEKAMKELSISEIGGKRLTVKVAEEKKKSFGGTGNRPRDNKGGNSKDRNRY